MSSLENLITEARLLGSRLRENEAFADTLISEANHIQEKLSAMKQVGAILHAPNQFYSCPCSIDMFNCIHTDTSSF